MSMKPKLPTLFLDVGGVLLTNGWDHAQRKAAAEFFHLDYPEIEKRHAVVFHVLEIGQLTLDRYLDFVIFSEKRPFSKDDFKQFMFRQSQPLDDMIQRVGDIKQRHGIKIVIVSNETRELNDYRVRTFRLTDIADCFVVSCFVGMTKPDPRMYKLALDLAFAEPHQTVYVDDRSILVEAASSIGIKGITHRSPTETIGILEQWLSGKNTEVSSL